ncbi:putative pyridoxal-dependent decarboxylase, C- sheet domain protein [Streptomyces himastatinicus ATCC 53653]|uniref:Putative pyridoxal-dependent decarboxylase, C-sheet domain protein n=1 Tax=Streptomyces himastatinicus ATCC 53653 TaxID=457427 RepID=D9WEG3_9ACTN|nr:decarboxylase [Streptomyces himastatinicus]EFL23202.1 putative pyridoxal-dependent decarboxylase, C- sheet domain protein [Streptomyces himastatinicus ATCC 53653]
MSRYETLEELAGRYGTPLYVYDLDRIDAARRDLFGWLPEGVEVYYAFKANPHVDLVRALREGDGPACKAEISSTGELAAALDGGYTGADILYTGPGKTPGELREAIARGVRTFSAESPGDLEHIGQAAVVHGVVADCLLRVNSATASASTGIRMTGKPTQFGIDSETVAELAPRLRSVPGTSIAGLHLFSQSNAKDEDALIEEFRHTIEVAAQVEADLGVALRLLDIGGGFSVPYGRHGARDAYPKLRGELEAALDLRFPRWRRGELRIAVESGRYLVGDSGTLLASVSNVKTSRDRRFVILDAGINTFGGMSGLGRILPVSIRIEGDAEVTGKGTLAGPLCTPGDLLAREIDLPELDEGDVIAIPNTGAYGPTASLLMFLGRPAPAEAVVRGGEVLSVSRIEHIRSPLPLDDA